MPNVMKQWMMSEFTDLFGEHRDFILVGFTGLNSEDTEALRKRVRERDLSMRVLRNRVARKAFGELGFEGLEPFLQGQTAAMLGIDDVVELSKAVAEFEKDNEALEIKGGYCEGQAYSKDEVVQLSKVPPVPVLIAGLAGAIVSPVSGVVRCVGNPVESFVRVLAAVADKKEQES